MCTVFAESEATSLMARGEKAANIALGLHLAIVKRTLAMRAGSAIHPLFYLPAAWPTTPVCEPC